MYFVVRQKPSLPPSLPHCLLNIRISAYHQLTAMEPEFTLAEMKELEGLYKELGEESLLPDFCQRIATSFSFTPNRVGKTEISVEQVLSWFLDRHKRAHPKVSSSSCSRRKGKCASMALRIFDVTDKNSSSNTAESSQNHKGRKASDITGFTFEARSAKDNAWYDVETFLTYRVLCTGELEVRARFSGFRNSDDEWVDMRTAVRERSIPLEPSECHMVKAGDLVMCFQEREEQAVYVDAYVISVERELHDMTGCSCIFHVRYDDGAEENVQVERLCRRPSQ